MVPTDRGLPRRVRWVLLSGRCLLVTRTLPGAIGVRFGRFAQIAAAEGVGNTM